MKNTALDLTADIIDVRDIIERIEELEAEAPENESDTWAKCDEYATLIEILEELKGGGGDEQWCGDWYPLTLIDEGYFTQYAEELVSECYDLSKIPHFVHIDWEKTAREVLHDYNSIEIDGRTYFYR